MFFDALAWGYTNARIRGMRGTILASNTLDEMVKVKSVPALVELLSHTPYKESISKATAKDVGDHLIEHATQLHFSATVSKIKKTLPKSGIKPLNALLERFDILNLKAIIGGRSSKKPYALVKGNIYPLGLLRESDCQMLYEAPDSSFLSTLRSTEFGKLLFEGKILSETHKKTLQQSLRDPARLYESLMVLDAYAYELFDLSLKASPSADTHAIRMLLKREVDAKNIILIERLKRLHFTPQKIQQYLISGGMIKPEQFLRLIRTQDPKEVRKFLASRFKDVTLSGDLDLVELEVSLERALAKEKTRLFTSAMFSIGVALGFLLLKEQEIFNIRKILKGKEFGLSEKDVQDMLVVV